MSICYYLGEGRRASFWMYYVYIPCTLHTATKLYMLIIA